MIISLKSIIITQGTQPGLCDNLEGRDGVGGGRKAQEGGDICIPEVDPC